MEESTAEKHDMVLSALERVKALAHRESSSTLCARIESKGFSHLSVETTFKKLKGASPLIAERNSQAFFQQAVSLSHLPINAALELESMAECEEYDSDIYRLTFATPSGRAACFVGYRRQRPDGKVALLLFTGRASFSLAPDTYIFRVSKFNFFKSKTEDKFMHVPRGICSEDVLAVEALMLRSFVSETTRRALEDRA